MFPTPLGCEQKLQSGTRGKIIAEANLESHVSSYSRVTEKQLSVNWTCIHDPGTHIFSLVHSSWLITPAALHPNPEKQTAFTVLLW